MNMARATRTWRMVGVDGPCEARCERRLVPITIHVAAAWAGSVGRVTPDFGPAPAAAETAAGRGGTPSWFTLEFVIVVQSRMSNASNSSEDMQRLAQDEGRVAETGRGRQKLKGAGDDQGWRGKKSTAHVQNQPEVDGLAAELESAS
jgi:hypothetical protein